MRDKHSTVFTPDYTTRYSGSVELGSSPVADTTELMWSLSGAYSATLDVVAMDHPHGLRFLPVVTLWGRNGAQVAAVEADKSVIVESGPSEVLEEIHGLLIDVLPEATRAALEEDGTLKAWVSETCARRELADAGKCVLTADWRVCSVYHEVLRAVRALVEGV
jgi:hypothetical protein